MILRFILLKLIRRSQTRKKGIKGRKLYSKVIEPQNKNIKTIPAISFSYFDPKLKEYRTITHPPTPITIEESDNETPIRLALKGIDDGKEQVRILTKDIVPIMSNLYYFKNKNLPLYKRPLFLTFIFIIPILCVLACIYIQNHSERLQTDVSYARKRRAPSQVKKRILDTRNIMQNASPTEFYSALDKTLTEYIANKVNLAPASITHDNVPDILGDSGVDQETIQEVKQCLESCDHARFSTDQQSKEQMENTLNAAERIIKQLERQL